MKKNRLSLLAISLLSISSLFAQSSQNRVLNPNNMRDGEHVEYCGNTKKMAEAMKNPEFAAQYKSSQAQLAKEESEKSGKPNNGTTKGTVYTIPVVFHVLHNGGVENISKEQIMSTLSILNRDYRKLNADVNTVQPEFTSLAADVEIEFALATKAPNGACFSGITRTQSALSYSGDDGQAQVNAIVAGNDVFQGQWAPNKYMNVYICGDIGGAAGYTFNPPGGTSMYFNGIFMLHNYTGNIGTSSEYTSRTLTHEVGHWYNLSHTWGGNNDPGVCGGTDNVADTPATRGSSSCNLQENFCGPKANVENYMDYSYCSKMFTTGQVTRMRTSCTSTTSGRNNLWTAGNLTATGANAALALCQAKFSAPKQIICTNESVQFTDESYNLATGWSWTFTGGTPATSTAQNPTVSYANPGVYTVELVATDGATSNTKTMTNYITVLPAGEGLPFYEGFESLTDFNGSTRWYVSNPAGNGWTVTNTAGNTGVKSAKLTNFGQAVDNVDELISGAVDLSGITTSATLSFRYAFRKRNSANLDLLKVYATKDCGDNWDVRKSLSANTMSGGVSVTSAWTPTANDWVTVHMTNITSIYWNENFRYKFEFTSDGGNNMYLDDINIYEGAPSDPLVIAGLEETLFQNTSVYPNPTDGDVNVRFTTQTAQDLNVVVTDLSGKTLQKHFIQAKTGENLVMLSSEGMANGMYLIQISDGSRYQTLQFVVK